MSESPALPARAPYRSPRLTSEIVYAVKAIQAGAATPAQQADFFTWLIVEVCRKDDLSFRPGGLDGQRDGDFAEGKRFVALSVLRAYNLSAEQVAAMRERELMERGLRPIEDGDESAP
jgi:hypothetical protein